MRGKRWTESSGCNSALCIGGTSDMLSNYVRPRHNSHANPVGGRFGISNGAADQLCYGDGVDILTTPEKGVACLRDIAAGRDVLEAIEAQA